MKAGKAEGYSIKLYIGVAATGKKEQALVAMSDLVGNAPGANSTNQPLPSTENHSPHLYPSRAKVFSKHNHLSQRLKMAPK